MSIELTVNGTAVIVTAAGDTPLLDVLRNHLDLKGSRYGCGLEQCGSCMVLIDGKAEYSCARDVASVAGRRVETVESLASHPLRQAFLDADDAARPAALEKLHRHLAEVQPYRVLGQYDQPVALRANVTGLLSSPVIVYWNIDKN